MSLAKTHLNPERDVNSEIAGIKIPDSKISTVLSVRPEADLSAIRARA
jgi:hypothetical protein